MRSPSGEGCTLLIQCAVSKMTLPIGDSIRNMPPTMRVMISSPDPGLQAASCTSPHTGLGITAPPGLGATEPAGAYPATDRRASDSPSAPRDETASIHPLATPADRAAGLDARDEKPPSARSLPPALYMIEP